jgi:hypothetical protein
MKTFFTHVTFILCAFSISQKAFSQFCNQSAGSDGYTVALPAAVTIDGNMADWTTYLNDPDNNSYDGTNGIDLDALSISSPSRDLQRFTFTEDMNYLYFYIQRASGSSNVDIVYYLDVNNNNVMESKEPVFHIDWKSNGTITITSMNYNPSLLSALVNTLSLNLDGDMLMGTLSSRSSAGPGTAIGKGSADGKSLEVKIPFTQITRLDALNNVTTQLAFGQNFKFHVSTINGNVSSIPSLGSIDDNFGACLKAPTFINGALPVKLIDFTARYDRTNVILNWETAQEMNFSHYVIENSTDGNVYTETATVFGAALEGAGAKYNYTDRSVAGRGGIIYYRLRMVDTDGKTTYSAVRVVVLTTAKDAVSISTFPNPVSSEVRIMVPANWQGKPVSYEITTITGQVVKNKLSNSSSQTETISVSDLSSGLYIVSVTCEGEKAHQKIVKQ